MPEAFTYLKRNTDRLAAEVVLHNIAAWGGRATLDFSDAGVINSSLNTAFAFRERTLTRVDVSRIDVQAWSLDEVLADTGPIHGIKVDAESAELQVLQGAVDVLRVSQPWVVVELGDLGPSGETLSAQPASAQIYALMTSLGYPAHVMVDGRVVPIDLVSPVRYLNVLFKPD